MPRPAANLPHGVFGQTKVPFLPPGWLHFNLCRNVPHRPFIHQIFQ
jgi:hypothetical protein